MSNLISEFANLSAAAIIELHAKLDRIEAQQQEILEALKKSKEKNDGNA